MKIQCIQISHVISTILLLLWKLTAALQQDVIWRKPDDKCLLIYTKCGQKDGFCDYDEVLYASACFHQVKKSLTLTCSRGQMVKLNRIFYAYTEDEDTCSYQSGHCTMDLPEFESYSCIGRSTCTINLPSGDTGKYIPKCDHYGTYAQAEYQCIPETETTNICRSDLATLISQRGFISTPNYPYNYPNNQRCSLRIEAPYPDQKISLFTIDLTLEENKTDCADWLHIFDGHRAVTYCAARAPVKEEKTLENWIELKFNSDANNTRKGFWLYYEAIPYREISTSAEQHPSPTLWSYITTASDISNKQGDTNQTYTESRKPQAQSTPVTPVVYKGNALTVGAIVGVAVSLLLLITVIILVILVCKRKDTSRTTVKVPSSVSCNSEAAFLNFGPTNCYAHTPQVSTSPSYLEYHPQGTNHNQPQQTQGSVNPDCEAVVTTADGYNHDSINNYNKLDAEYYKKSGRYLEEVI